MKMNSMQFIILKKIKKDEDGIETKNLLAIG